MSSPVQTSFADYIFEIKISINDQNTFNLNAFSALDRALDEASATAGLRVLILSSASPEFFSFGLDPHAIHGASTEDLSQILEYFFKVLKKIYLFPVPVIASIGGHALGYGAMLASMCDFRLLVDKGVRMSFPEMNIGVTLPAFVTIRLTDLVGERAVRDFLFSSFAPKPPEALAVGLVDELVEKEKLADRTRSFAKRLSGLPREAVRKQKEILRTQYGRNFDAIVSMDKKNTLEFFEKDEPREGFASMVEKRRPVFK